MRKVLLLMGILNDTDVQWLATNGRKNTVQPGAVLIREGVPVPSLFILLDGRLAVQVGNGMEVAILQTGEVVGEVSFVDSRPPLASVVVQSTSVVLAVEQTLLKRKLASDTAFASRFYHAIALSLADRLRSTTSRLSGNNTGEEGDADELDADLMNVISVANVRFDMLLRSVQ